MKRMTITFLGSGAAILAAGLLLGISDNPPGIFLVYGAVVCFLLAIVHRWRTARRFLWLLAASILGFPVGVLAHNLFYGLGQWGKEIPLVPPVAETLHVCFFLVTLFLCPAGALVGAAGAIREGLRPSGSAGGTSPRRP